MTEPIEITIDSPAGIIDCRLEPIPEADDYSMSITILYPNIINGYSRSEIYCHTMVINPTSGAYIFNPHDEDIHPKIRNLEKTIAEKLKENR